MNMMQINSLFTLFSGETDLNKYSPLIDSAVSQVTSQLREGADISDTRLDYLCAAIANYRYSQIVCVKNKIAFTYAGTADSKGNSQMEYDLAKGLMTEFYKAASGLLSDNSFVFSAIA